MTASTRSKPDLCNVRVELFEKRLAVDGLSTKTVTEILSRDLPFDELPEWTTSLSAFLDVPAETALRGAIGANIPLPFEEVLVPLVWFADRRLNERVGDAYKLLSDNGQTCMRNSLLSELSTLSSQTLALEFAVYKARRSVKENHADPVESTPTNAPERRLYMAYTAMLTDGRLLPLFMDYPVLARLLFTLVENWIGWTGEFVERLSRDSRKLEACFALKIGEECVRHCGANISDPHHGGRRAIIVAIGDQKIVYKPRGLSMDSRFKRLLEWVNDSRETLDLKYVDVIDMRTHGWESYVEHKPCEDYAQASRYFERTGGMLCLLHLLEATDVHLENWIASGEFPILVDTETLMHHRPKMTDGDSIAKELKRRLEGSVVRIGLLPMWSFFTQKGKETTDEEKRCVIDFSALGAVDKQELNDQRPHWEDINTDSMRLSYRTVRAEPVANLAIVDGQKLYASDYCEEILSGFGKMYDLVLRRRQELLSPRSPIMDFQTCRSRYVLRATRLYGCMHSKLRRPGYLKDAMLRSFELDRLSVSGVERPELWVAIEAEVASMARLDVPHFESPVASNDFCLDEGTAIPGLFEAPSFDRVIERLRCMGPEDLRWQESMIAGSMHVKATEGTPERSDDSVLQRGVDGSDGLLEICLEIAGRLIKDMVVVGGRGSWITPVIVDGFGLHMLRPMDIDMYNGRVGPGLFLAALFAITQDSRYREMALLALRMSDSTLEDEVIDTHSCHRLGSGAGIGAVVYGLATGARP